MPYRQTKIRSLIDVDPEAACAKLLEAYEAEGGNEAATARRLGCSHRNLARWRQAIDAAGYKLTEKRDRLREDARIRRTSQRDVRKRARRRFDVEQPEP